MLAARVNAAHPFAETFMVERCDRRRARPVRRASPRRCCLQGLGSIPRIRSPRRRSARWRPNHPRELFERLHDELPYQATVETDSWKDQADGSARVEQTVFVTRDTTARS